MKCLMSILIFIASLNITIGQNDGEPPVVFYQVMDALYKSDYELADRLMDEQHLLGEEEYRSYLKVYRAFLTFVSHQDAIHYRLFDNCFEEFQEGANKKSSNQRLWMKANVYLQKSVVELSMDHAYTSYFYLYRFLKEYQKSRKAAPQLTENHKLEYIAAALIHGIPQQAHWLAGLTGLDDGLPSVDSLNFIDYYDQVKGIPGLQHEARLILLFSDLKFGTDYSDEVESDVLMAVPVNRFFAGMLAVKKKNHAILQRCLDDIPSSQLEAFPLLHYVKGVYDVQTGCKSSRLAFEAFLKDFPGDAYKADAHLKLAWHYLLCDDSTNAWRCITDVCALPAYPTAKDKQALSEASYFGEVDTVLLRARLLFDAGHYKPAVDLLLSNRANGVDKPSQIIEYHYRLGRIYEVLEQRAKALECYATVVQTSQNDQRYFGPYAALQAVNLLMQRGNYESAAYYLQQASELNNGEYKADIEREVKKMKHELEVKSSP
jgi:tetratricopeptide (TPR) repeat protein